ncbi:MULTISPECIES: hypothetical protein [unclassified Rhizobium]|uniref:hypothetical protein n=1 Tax=unclassified Rhizobium TaxID=2613769 RepID=UPI0013C537F6|nr:MULTISPECIES: hypothetical protein [unclassified Rhizobium]
MPQLAASIWADGPYTDPIQPLKSDIRAWGTWLESIVNAFTSNGGLLYTSRAALYADLAHAAPAMAWVLGDATTAYNGIYVKAGASGSGSWARAGDLPFSFVIASDIGAGTPTAIQATSTIPVSGSALSVMNVFEANTASPVTVSFNGGAALTIKTNSGNDVASDGLAAGMLLFGYISGSTFRCINGQVSNSIVAAAEAAQAAAEAALGAVPNVFALTRTALKGLNTATLKSVFLKEASREGQFVWRSGDYSSKISADTAEGMFIKANAIASTAGAWVRVYTATSRRRGLAWSVTILRTMPRHSIRRSRLRGCSASCPLSYRQVSFGLVLSSILIRATWRCAAPGLARRRSGELSQPAMRFMLHPRLRTTSKAFISPTSQWIQQSAAPQAAQ